MLLNSANTRPLTVLDAPVSPYVAYTYSYPHKTAYRPLHPAQPLRDVWKNEDKRSLFLYIHIPFCEMRCGFCNLFTTANPREQTVHDYLDALERQSRIVADAVRPEGFARMAIGGGTPTLLDASALERVLGMSQRIYGIGPGSLPISVETSPRTAEADRLGVLKSFGVQRISIGVQSFVEAEVTASARAQKNEWVQTAIERIRALAFPILNIDLIYGLPGQTVQSWLHSLRTALQWQPEELYLYPLYVRPLTGLDRRGCESHDALRLECYRAGRDLLFERGYEQISMRMFRRAGKLPFPPPVPRGRVRVGVPSDACGNQQLPPPQPSPGVPEEGVVFSQGADPVYCCQDDGMLGLGCGARSYTRRLHYSTDFAVGSTGVREIIDAYIARTDEQFAFADYGCTVDDEEYRRRWLIKSLFRTGGFLRSDYRRAIGSDALDDFSELARYESAGYLTISSDRIVPTPAGLELSDALGPELFSSHVKQMMSAFELR